MAQEISHTQTTNKIEVIEIDANDWFYRAAVQDFEMFVAIHCYTFFGELFLLGKIDISRNKCKDNVYMEFLKVYPRSRKSLPQDIFKDKHCPNSNFFWFCSIPLEVKD